MTYELMLQDAKDDAYNKGRNEGRFSTELKNIKKLINKM